MLNKFSKLFSIVLACFSIVIKAQTVNTFTATNAQISDTLVSGGVIQAQCIHANDSIIANSDILANDNLKVIGNINLGGSLVLDPVEAIGMKLLPANTVNNPYPIISFGKAVNQPIPIAPTCPITGTASSPWISASGGGFMTHSANGPINAALKLYTAGWNGWGHIEVEGTNEVGQDKNALAINYFCGRETQINTNTGLPNGGGWVRMGNQVSMKKHLEIGDPQFGINDSANTALQIHANAGKGLEFKSYNGSVKLISIDNSFFPNSSLFTVYGDGRTYIGEKTPNPSGVHAGAKLSVDGKILCKSLYVTIANGIWADYVFENGYGLMKLKDLEKFVYDNKHLPNVPNSIDIEKNGLNIELTTARLLEKIEEAYLYIIDLNKRIEELEKKCK